MPNGISLALIVVLALAAATAEAFPALPIAPVDVSKDLSDSVILVRKGKGGKGDGDERYERYHAGRWYPHHRRHYHGMRAMQRHYGYGHYQGGRGNQNQPDGQN